MTDTVLKHKEIQHMAEDKISGVIQDLLAPITSVRSLSEILHDFPNINGKKRQEFLDIIIRETERMSGSIERAEAPIRPVS
jgi:signal transduction histidine kinase